MRSSILQSITPEIKWPPQYRPDNSAVHVVNELEMEVPIEAAWNCLIRASEWPSWYPNAANVKLLGTDKTVLAKGVSFRWKTFGMTITCTVEECEPFERLAWSSEQRGMKVYHAWLLEERPKNFSAGCYVRTEETQNGFIPKLAAKLMPGKMHKFHQIWLEGLSERAKEV